MTLCPFNYNKKYVIYVVHSTNEFQVFFIFLYASYQLGPDGTDKWDTLQGIFYNKTKCNLHILRVKSENLMHMPEALPKRDFTNLHRNTVIIMSTAVCDVNTESKMNVVIRRNACKKYFTCPCPGPFYHCCYYFWCFFGFPGHGTNWSGFLAELGPTHFQGQP